MAKMTVPAAQPAPPSVEQWDIEQAADNDLLAALEREEANLYEMVGSTRLVRGESVPPAVALRARARRLTITGDILEVKARLAERAEWIRDAKAALRAEERRGAREALRSYVMKLDRALADVALVLGEMKDLDARAGAHVTDGWSMLLDAGRTESALSSWRRFVVKEGFVGSATRE